MTIDEFQNLLEQTSSCHAWSLQLLQITPDEKQKAIYASRKTELKPDGSLTELVQEIRVRYEGRFLCCGGGVIQMEEGLVITLGTVTELQNDYAQRRPLRDEPILRGSGSLVHEKFSELSLKMGRISGILYMEEYAIPQSEPGMAC